MSYHFCPVCGGSLQLIHRRFIDRLISQFYRVHRYRCSNDECRWVGLLHSRHHKARRESQDHRHESW